MHIIAALDAPKVACYGTNYKLYVEHYKLYRATVESFRSAASVRDANLAKARKDKEVARDAPKGKSKETPPKPPLTPEQEAGRKAHKLHLRREKRERRRLRKLEKQVKIAELEKKLAGANKAKAQASLATTKARAEVPLLATKVEVAKGVYANAKAAARRDAIKIDKEIIQQAAQRDTAVIQHDTALNKAAVQLEESRLRLHSVVDPNVNLGHGLDATDFTKRLLQFGSIKFEMTEGLTPSQTYALSRPMPVSAKGVFNYRLEQLAESMASAPQPAHQPATSATATTTHYDARGRVTGTTISVRQ